MVDNNSGHPACGSRTTTRGKTCWRIEKKKGGSNLLPIFCEIIDPSIREIHFFCVRGESDDVPWDSYRHKIFSACSIVTGSDLQKTCDTSHLHATSRKGSVELSKAPIPGSC